jgi:hypothetical protein
MRLRAIGDGLSAINYQLSAQDKIHARKSDAMARQKLTETQKNVRR